MYNKAQAYAVVISVLCIIFFIPALFLDTSKYISFKEYLTIVPTLIIGSITSYIAYQQHNISKEQKKIAQDKHRLELFEKRYEIYELFLKLSLSSRKIKMYKNLEANPVRSDIEWAESEKYREFVDDNIEKMFSLGEQSRFLFDENVYRMFCDARVIISHHRNVLKEIRIIKSSYTEPTSFTQEVYQSQKPELKVNIDTITKLKSKLDVFYAKTLPEAMEPYLKMAPYTYEKTKY